MTTPIPPNPKPGYKTSEFWLSTASMALGAMFASGIFEGADENSLVMRAVGAAMTVLGALGYTVSRARAKSGK
ncbi:MAG TPA: hypothetical protein VM487_15640 [Phycisphaerae bacterium]|nr:hypothetical protein [Phycisphaerae bacterium]